MRIKNECLVPRYGAAAEHGPFSINSTEREIVDRELVPTGRISMGPHRLNVFL
jgi:hypothetical protein